jgi:peptide/nickel transport system permease protein
MTLTPGPELAETGSVVRHDDGALLLPGAEEATVGVGPYQLAWRRLRRNRSALVFGGLFILIVLACLLAPVYADHIADTGPNVNHISEVITVGGHQKDVVSLTGTPIGPTWHSHFFFGADANGRDVAVRLLYGGRNSLEISALATVITIGIGTIVALVAGYFGGWADSLLSRILDLIWAYPVLLLGVALGVTLSISGLDLGLFTLKGGSDVVPALIIGVVYIPYVARPIRGEVLSLRNREFVDAARALGAGRLRIMFSEILPNLANTLVVFIALQLAQSIILEASLSFLGAGVQAPNSSWGTMLQSGVSLLETAPHLTAVPGVMLVLAVLSVNIVGDGLRRALDPRARVTIK